MLQSRFRSDAFYLLILLSLCGLGVAQRHSAAPAPQQAVAPPEPQGYPTAFPGIAGTPISLKFNPEYNAALSATHRGALSASGEKPNRRGPHGCQFPGTNAGY